MHGQYRYFLWTCSWRWAFAGELAADRYKGDRERPCIQPVLLLPHVHHSLLRSPSREHLQRSPRPTALGKVKSWVGVCSQGGACSEDQKESKIFSPSLPVICPRSQAANHVLVVRFCVRRALRLIVLLCSRSGRRKCAGCYRCFFVCGDVGAECWRVANVVKLGLLAVIRIRWRMCRRVDTLPVQSTFLNRVTEDEEDSTLVGYDACLKAKSKSKAETEERPMVREGWQQCSTEYNVLYRNFMTV